jgi:hypothetical protein
VGFSATRFALPGRALPRTSIWRLDCGMTTDMAPPTRQALAAQNRSLPNRVTGRLRRAITEMVWSGARRADAAKAAGMTDHSLRAALRKPHVIAFYRGELGILRESERAKTLHRLCDMRDQDSNKMASVAASKALEQISDEAVHRPQHQQTPGFVIVVQNGPSHASVPPTGPVTIEAQREREPALLSDQGGEGGEH